MSNVENVTVYGVIVDARRLASLYGNGYNWIAVEENGYGIDAYIAKPQLSETRGMYDWTNMEKENLYWSNVPNYDSDKMQPIRIDSILFAGVSN